MDETIPMPVITTRRMCLPVLSDQVLGVEQADAQMQEGLKQMASELGKEKYDTSLRLANNTLKQFADESIGKWLQDSGMGNSPQLVKLLAKIGERLAEDSPTTANLQGNKSKTPEQTMYPDMK